MAAISLALLPLLMPLLSHAAVVPASVAPGIPALSVQNGAGGGQTYTLTIQLLALMTAITLLPAALLMMTAFTRIIIVLSILRQAIGAGQSPPNQVLIGLAMGLNLLALGTSRMPSLIRTVSLQGVVLSILPLLMEHENDWRVALLAMAAAPVSAQTPFTAPVPGTLPARPEIFWMRSVAWLI